MVIVLLGMCREAGIPTLDVPRQRMSGASAVPMIKGKFGGKLWSRSGTGQVNEALCKVLCHNVCVVVQSMYELGIEATFWPDEAAVALG
jgi:hypothetical protein